MEIGVRQIKAGRSLLIGTLGITLGSVALIVPQGSLADDSAAAAGKALSNSLSREAVEQA